MSESNSNSMSEVSPNSQEGSNSQSEDLYSSSSSPSLEHEMKQITVSLPSLTIDSPEFTFSGKTVKIRAKDSTSPFEVPIEVINMSISIKNMIDDLGGDRDVEIPEIPIDNISEKHMKLIITYCTDYIAANRHETKPDKDLDDLDVKPRCKPVDLTDYDMKFCKDMDDSTIFGLMLAANFLDIKPLLDVLCKTIADQIRGRTTEEIRKRFNIENDFTPEEEEEIRAENQWCEDEVANPTKI